MPVPVKTMLSYSPKAGDVSNGVRHFSFYVPGILFALAVGNPGSEGMNTCFFSNPLHPILIKDLSEKVERLPKEMYFKGKAAMALRSNRHNSR